MKKYSIKLIKTGVFGLFQGETLITWSCSAARLFNFLNTFSLRTVLLNRKRAMIRGLAGVVRNIDNTLNGLGKTMLDVQPVADLDEFSEYKMKTIIEYYKKG